MQFGYVLVFATLAFADGRPRFGGVTGTNDEFDHQLVSIEFSDKQGAHYANKPPTILAIVGDVEIMDSGLRSIRVSAVLTSEDEVQEAKRRSDSKYQGVCGSVFAAHWKAAK